MARRARDGRWVALGDREPVRGQVGRVPAGGLLRPSAANASGWSVSSRALLSACRLQGKSRPGQQPAQHHKLSDLVPCRPPEYLDGGPLGSVAVVDPISREVPQCGPTCAWVSRNSVITLAVRVRAGSPSPVR